MDKRGRAVEEESDHLSDHADNVDSKDPLLSSKVEEGSLKKEPGSVVATTGDVVATPQQTSSNLIFCFIGLQASYLTWGYVQEKVMTREYTTGRFPSAT
jgi:hypothetical protein